MAAIAAIFYGKSAGVTQHRSVFTKNGIAFTTTLYNIKIYIVLLYNVWVSMSYYQEIMKEISGNMQDLSKDIPAVMKAFSGLVGASTTEGHWIKKPKNSL